MQLISQSAVAAPQFSFRLASDNSELYLGGMRSSDFVAGTTEFYPVSTQSYWVIPGSVNLAGVPVLQKLSCIIDTGTSVVVVRSTLHSILR